MKLTEAASDALSSTDVQVVGTVPYQVYVHALLEQLLREPNSFLSQAVRNLGGDPERMAQAASEYVGDIGQPDSSHKARICEIANTYVQKFDHMYIGSEHLASAILQEGVDPQVWSSVERVIKSPELLIKQIAAILGEE